MKQLKYGTHKAEEFLQNVLYMAYASILPTAAPDFDLKKNLDKIESNFMYQDNFFQKKPLYQKSNDSIKRRLKFFHNALEKIQQSFFVPNKLKEEIIDIESLKTETAPLLKNN
jgi:hypothetical protein